ncbi:MAG: GIY-YIG nuclease family protein, partial [Gammaproteobacteria bacterium]
TTCVAAERLEREWVGIDVAKEAWNQIEKRLKKEVPPDLLRGEAIFSTTPPKRGKQDSRPTKYVYVISNPAYKGMYKVGVAADAEARLSSYQTADPQRQYRLEFKLRTPEYKVLEPHIHRQFGGDHEWVQGELAAIISAIKSYRP